MNQKHFMNESKFILRQGKTDGENFWKTLQQKNYEDSASFYCMQIFENLTSPQRKQITIENEQKLYATLLALQYYKDRKPKSEQTVKACKQYMQKNANYIQKWILELFISPHKDQQFGQHFMNHLVLFPKDINWNGNIILQIQQNLQQIQNTVHASQFKAKQKLGATLPTIRRCFYPQPAGIKIKEMGLAYVCFLDLIRGNMNQMRIEQYQHMLAVFNALINCVKINDFWLNYLCVFMHFVTNCFTYYSCAEQTLVRDLLVLVNHMRGCWGVAGQMANQLFEILHKQLRVPGHAFRKKLRRDFSALDRQDCSFLNNEYYLVSEGEDCFSCPEDRSLLNLRKLMIWHIMKISNLEQQKINEYTEMLRTMANDMTFQLYFKSMKIVDIAGQLEVYEKIKHVMKDSMLNLLKQTAERCKKQRKKASQMEIEEFDSLIQDDNELHIFRYPLFEIVHIPLNEFINVKSRVNFYSLREKNLKEQSNLLFYQGSLSIIFYGTSHNFIGVVQILSKFLQDADIEEFRQLKVFYLPKPESNTKPEIASYIASKDIWYNQFVYSVFKQQLAYPHLEPNKSSKNLFPLYMMNKSLHMYLREAKRIFNLNVYLCKLKLKDSDRIESVYFTQSVMVGLFAEAEIIRINKLKSQQKVGKYENMNVFDIIKEKISKSTTVGGSIVFQYKQAFSKAVLTKKQEGIRFDDLQICNLPRQYFFGNKPDPSGNLLKLSLLTEANAKVFLKEIKNSENFRENKTDEQILLAFKDIFVNYSIKRFQLRKKDDVFKVLVDGVLYNKVEGFTIELPLTVNQLPISIPIQTFLPFK